VILLVLEGFVNHIHCTKWTIWRLWSQIEGRTCPRHPCFV